MQLLTTAEVCEVLKKSSKTVQRYVKKGLLNPKTVKTEWGTVEYRFDRSEVDNLKDRETTIVHDVRSDRGQERQQETLPVLIDQLKMKDNQMAKKDEQIKELSDRIKELIERDRERNVLMKDMQDKLVLMLPGQGRQTQDTVTVDTKDMTKDKGQDKTLRRYFPTIFKLLGK